MAPKMENYMLNEALKGGSGSVPRLARMSSPPHAAGAAATNPFKQSLNVFENKKLKKEIQLVRNKRIKRDLNSDGEEESMGESSSEESASSETGEDEDEQLDENDKKKLLRMLNTSSLAQLTAIPTCSTKRAELIIELRPYTSHADIVKKFRQTKGLALSILDKYFEMLEDYSQIGLLLNNCAGISNKVSESIKEESRTEIDFDSFLAFPLKEYQVIGFNWLRILYESGLGGILADEMGLGKTIQAISLIAYAKLVKKDAGPFLIVVPTSTLDNWLREITKWCPTLKICEFFGGADQRDAMRAAYKKNPGKWDVFLTSYAIINNKNDDNFIKKISFSFALFDEGHMLKNMSSQRYTKLTAYKAKTRFLLTGTPLQNNLLELMSLIMFILPSVFKSLDDKDLIKRLFGGNKMVSSSSSSNTSPASEFNPSEEGCSEQQPSVAGTSKQEADDEIHENYVIFTKSQEIIHPFVLRRVKKDVLSNIPCKLIHVKKIQMAMGQRVLYQNLIDEFRQQKIDDGETRLKNITMQLRKMANHPLHHLSQYTDDKLHDISRSILMEPEYFDKSSEYIYEDLSHMSDFEIHKLCKKFKSIARFRLNNDKIMDCGKFEFLQGLLPQLHTNGDRVLIFSQFVMTLDILEEFLNIIGYKYVRLDGSTNAEERQMIIDTFNNTDNTQSAVDVPFIFLLSTRAGGVGINLATANVIILYDIDFNPHNDKQAEDRAHRVGQTKEVNVYKLISEDSIEEHILNLANKKLALEKDVSECAKELKEDMYKVLQTVVQN